MQLNFYEELLIRADLANEGPMPTMLYTLEKKININRNVLRGFKLILTSSHFELSSKVYLSIQSPAYRQQGRFDNTRRMPFPKIDLD